MVKLTDLKPGDIVRVMDDGAEREGIVIDIDRNDHLVCIDYGVQEFWFPVDQVLSIPLDEEQLLKLGFEREPTDKGVKYMKGPFRLLSSSNGNLFPLEVWYREDRRHFEMPLMVHELQNHYLEMTKVPLERPVIH